VCLAWAISDQVQFLGIWIFMQIIELS